MLSKKTQNTFTTLTWMLIWTSFLFTFACFLPGFCEFDTSKYLTIAQNMMTRHDYLTAYWHGHLYSDKPPLLFWLIIAGWKLFGFSSWWPQLIVLLFATLSIFASQKLAKSLWHHNENVAKITPFILIGCFYWVWFAKQIRVDAILVLAALLSIYCIVKTLQGQRKYWLGFAFSLGLGGFAKGPVILVFALLPIIFMPGILQGETKFTPKWYGMLGLTTVIGICIPLLWAIPAAIIGGKAFTHEIFYRQITHRANYHHRSLFFYLVRLPIWLLPWSIYPPVWKGLKSMNFHRPSGEFACFVIIISGLVVFSVFGQKLPHYIYPLFPIFAILMAYLTTRSPEFKHKHQRPIAVFVLLFALFCLTLPELTTLFPKKLFLRSYFLQDTSINTWGWSFFIFAAVLFAVNLKTRLIQIIGITLVFVLIALFINNVVLFSYQKHISDNVLINQLRILTENEVIVVDKDKIVDKRLVRFIQRHHYSEIKSSELTQWKKTHKTNWVLSANFIPTKTQKPTTWFYQTRYSIVALTHA